MSQCGRVEECQGAADICQDALWKSALISHLNDTTRSGRGQKWAIQKPEGVSI